MAEDVKLNRVQQAALKVLNEHALKLAVRQGDNGTEIHVRDFDPADGTPKSFVLQEIAQALRVFAPEAQMTLGGSMGPGEKRSVLAVTNKPIGLEEKLQRAGDAFEKYKRDHGGKAPVDNLEVDHSVPDRVAEVAQKLADLGVNFPGQSDLRSRTA